MLTHPYFGENCNGGDQQGRSDNDGGGVRRDSYKCSEIESSASRILNLHEETLPLKILHLFAIFTLYSAPLILLHRSQLWEYDVDENDEYGIVGLLVGGSY